MGFRMYVFDEDDPNREFTCPICGGRYDCSYRFGDVLYAKDDSPVAVRSYDCHGIPFRMICVPCADDIDSRGSYDGEYYTELDECIDYDY